MSSRCPIFPELNSAHHYSISSLKSVWLNRVLPEIFSHILLFINTGRYLLLFSSLCCLEARGPIWCHLLLLIHLSPIWAWGAPLSLSLSCNWSNALGRQRWYLKGGKRERERDRKRRQWRKRKEGGGRFLLKKDHSWRKTIWAAQKKSFFHNQRSLFSIRKTFPFRRSLTPPFFWRTSWRDEPAGAVHQLRFINNLVLTKRYWTTGEGKFLDPKITP